MLAYLAGTAVLIVAGFVYFRKVAKLSAVQSVFHVMGIACSNSGFVGYPILLLTFAPIAGMAVGLDMLLENLIIIPILLLLAERAQGHATPRHALATDAGANFGQTHPQPDDYCLAGWFCSLALGFAFAYTCGTCSQFICRVQRSNFVVCDRRTLTGLAFDGVLPKIWPIVVGKLVLHPVCVWLALLLLTGLGFAELNGPLKTSAVLMAATPMMGTYPILAQAYGQEELSAAALLLATPQSFFSISTLLWAFHSLPM